MTLAAPMTTPAAPLVGPGSEEEQLIEYTREGDLRAFEVLVERYQPRVNRVTMSVLKNTADAEEVAQDVFLTVFGKIEHFRGDSSFWTWVHRIAVNSALMRRRRLKTNTHMSLEEVMPSFDERGYIHGSVVDWSQTAGDPAIQEEERMRIKEAVARLEYKYRIVFVLRQLEELSTEETARILGLTTAAVKSRLHRARLFLRSHLADYFAEHLN
jgi:RNA polymerase sigma-70 factor (ECF subfamily)